MKKVKVVFNSCYGGFGLSKMAMERLAQLGVPGADEELSKRVAGYFDSYSFYDLPRHHPLLIQVVEELGEQANGQFSYLKVIELDGDRYIIDEYDGRESVVEPADISWIVAGE